MEVFLPDVSVGAGKLAKWSKRLTDRGEVEMRVSRVYRLRSYYQRGFSYILGCVRV